MVIVLLAFVSSHNMLLSIGIKQPFMKVNERLQELKTYADIVFAQSGGSSSKKEGGQGGAGGTVMYVARSLILAAGLGALAAVDFAQGDLTLARALIIAAVALAVI